VKAQGVAVSVPIWAPTDENLRRAADLLRAGELVVMPTETVYGLGCLPSAEAVQRLFHAKGRPESRPIPILVSSTAALKQVVLEWPPQAQALIEAFWPGPLTIVVPAAPSLPQELTAGTGTVGVRQPRHPVAIRLLELAGGYLAVTSANRSGEEPAATAQEAVAALGASVAAAIDGGPAELGVPSTVVSLVGGEVQVLRLGAIGKSELLRVLRAGPARSRCTIPSSESDLR
jgi:L-threonylcarbamoyladenylate synthase